LASPERRSLPYLGKRTDGYNAMPESFSLTSWTFLRAITKSRILTRVHEQTVQSVQRGRQDTHAFEFIHGIVVMVGSVRLVHTGNTGNQVLERLVFFKQFLQVFVSNKRLQDVFVSNKRLQHFLIQMQTTYSSVPYSSDQYQSRFTSTRFKETDYLASYIRYDSYRHKCIRLDSKTRLSFQNRETCR
jgi:hypothetical protein